MTSPAPPFPAGMISKAAVTCKFRVPWLSILVQASRLGVILSTQPCRGWGDLITAVDQAALSPSSFFLTLFLSLLQKSWQTLA